MSAPKIRRVVIENLRRIERLELSLVGPDDKPVRQFVIAGPNGSGKTTVLEAILLALGRDDLLKRDADHVRLPGGLPAGASVEVELETSAGVRRIERRGLGKMDHTSFSSVPTDLPTIPIEYWSSWRAPHLVGALQPLARARRPRDTEANRLWRLKQRLIDEKSRRSFSGKTGRESEWLASINRAWRKLHGSDGTSLDVQLVDENSEDAFADLFVMKNGTRLCAADQLSSGELELLTAAGWLVTNGMRDGILLIDEPELHLHPQWQATFLPALRELAPEIQIIASTHSDAPWDQAQPWERALFVDASDPRSSAWREAHAVPQDGG